MPWHSCGRSPEKDGGGVQLKPGYKQTEVGVIPEEWDVSSLNDCCSKITDGTHDTPKPVQSGIPYITAIHVKDNCIDFQSCLYVTKADHDIIFSRCNPRQGDVLLVNIGAGVATTAIIDVDYEFSLKNVALLKPNRRRIAGEYLNYCLADRKPKITQALSSGGAQPFLSLTQIGEIIIPLPPPEEQLAVAGALSDVDALIGALDKLIAKKRDIKQAAMQQLLTGKLRLPGFSGKWEVKPLGEIAPLQRGFDLPTSQLQPGNYPVVYSNGVLNRHSIYMAKGPGVVTGRSGTIGKVNYVEEDYWPHNTTLWVTSFRGNFPKFVYFLYTHIGLERFGTGSGVPTLNRNDVHAHRVALPPTTEEQTAIATVLSDMDAEIAEIEKRRDKTRAVKQGMMQELLTGKTRLV